MKRLLAVAALAVTSFSASAALTPYGTWNPPRPQIAGAEFNVQSSNGNTIAMGAHPYTSGVTMPNNGVDTYYGAAGLATPTRAKWSFDWAWDLTNCNGCSMELWVDVDKSAGVDLVRLINDTAPVGSFGESWNMEMVFMAGALGYDFDPYSPSSTAFSLRLIDAQNSANNLTSDITVNVPEPGTLALFSLGLAGLAGMMRRRKQA